MKSRRSVGWDFFVGPQVRAREFPLPVVVAGEGLEPRRSSPFILGLGFISSPSRQWHDRAVQCAGDELLLPSLRLLVIQYFQDRPLLIIQDWVTRKLSQLSHKHSHSHKTLPSPSSFGAK